MKFQFATANRIVFGAGSIQQIGEIAKEFGTHALIVTGTSSLYSDRLQDILRDSGLECSSLQVTGEPSVEMIREKLLEAREFQPEMIIGFGGGSVIDSGKAIAAMLSNPGDLLDYLEVVGKNQSLRFPPLPYIAAPTTAGTGSEVTRNAVLGVAEKKVKVSLRSPFMLPKVAVVDPEVTCSVPPAVTATTGMDALTQVLEPFVSSRANPMVDLFCLEGLEKIANSIFHAYRDGTNLAARTDMAWASLLGGLALANAGLGAVHGFAGPIGGMFDASHGAICARLLPFVYLANVKALSERQPSHPAFGRYQIVAQILTQKPGATIADGARWLDVLSNQLEIPPLRTYGISETDFDTIVEKARAASSMQANPIRLTDQELIKILQAAL